MNNFRFSESKVTGDFFPKVFLNRVTVVLNFKSRAFINPEVLSYQMEKVETQKI